MPGHRDGFGNVERLDEGVQIVGRVDGLTHASQALVAATHLTSLLDREREREREKGNVNKKCKLLARPKIILTNYSGGPPCSH